MESVLSTNDVRRRTILLLILTFILTAMPLAIAGETPQIDSGKRAQVDAIIEQMLQEGHYPGIGLAIEYKGAVYEKGYGLADVEHQVPVTPDTVFPIGSVSKSFTALAIMQLVDQGKVSLDAPLGQYLTEYSGPARDVPIRRLLNHTNGLPDYADMPEFESNPEADITVQQFMAAVEKKPLEFKPGDLFSYTNTDIFLLGLVVEHVSGIPLASYLKQHIWEPFGMSHTYLAGYAEIVPNRARGYEWGGSFENAEQTSVTQSYAPGGIMSITDDMLKYRRGVFEGNKTSPAIRKNLLTQDSLNDGTRLDYALGCLIVRDFNGHRKISHAGVIAGYAALYAYYPDDDLTIMVETNNDYSSIQPYAIELKLARAMLDIPSPKIVDLPVPVDDVAAFTGDFELTPIRFATSRYGFVAKDGKLFAKAGGVESKRRPMPLLYQGNGKFVTAADIEWAFQFSSERPKANHMSFEWFDGVFKTNRSDVANTGK